jgi:hypothetical protein
MLQLRRTSLHGGSALSGKRTGALQESTGRMLWLTKRRHDRRPNFWHYNHNSWVGLVSANNRLHRQLLEYPLAHHNSHLRHPHPLRRTLWTTKIYWDPQLLKAQLAPLADSPVVPFRKQNSKPEHIDC